MDYFQYGQNENEANDNLNVTQGFNLVAFVVWMAWKSSFILTTKSVYSSITLLTKNNIKINLIFTLHSSLFPFISNNSTNLHSSKFLLGEKENYVYVECKRLLSFCTKGYLENICITKLVCCAT
jgi:hypothetical protein